MPTLPQDDFIHQCETLLNWDIEEHLSDERYHLTRQHFWDEVYLTRRNEIAVFEQFLRSPRMLMIINGNVGVGKSTYVRHKFERERLCRGVIVNMMGRLYDISNADTLAKDLREVIGEEYRLSLINNFKASTLYNSPYEDITQSPDSIQRQHADWNHALTETRSSVRLALEALLYLQRDPALAQYANKTFGLIVAATPEEHNEQLRIRFMEDPARFSSEVMGLLSWKHYVMLYHELQRNGPMPHVMVFDNLDWLRMTVIQHEFINTALDILNELRRNGTTMKAITCVRDENVAYFHHNAGASVNVFQVLFSKDDYVIHGVSDRHYLSADEDDFSHEVLKRRMVLVKARLAEAHPQMYALFEGIINNFWMKNGTVRNELGHFRFGDLCNGSLRIMLGLVYDGTLDLVQRLRSKGLTQLPGDENNEPYATVRGSLICQLAYNRRTRDIIREFYQSVLNERGETYCCVYRMMLVLLDNHRKRNNRQYTVSNLQSDLKHLFSHLSESDTRRYLKDLYFCGEHHGELLVIYQKKLIHQPDDIDDDATLQITGRGQVFVHTVLIHYDFFKGILAHKEKRRPAHILFDMNPEEALKKSQEIRKLVHQLSERHVKVLKETVYPNLLPHRTKYQKPFLAYKGLFLAVGDALYLERVCDNHKGLLKGYIAECMRGPEGGTVLLSQEERAELQLHIHYDWIKTHCVSSKGATHLDKEIEEQVNRLPEQHPLRTLWEQVHHAYDPIKTLLEKVRDVKWEDVPGAGRAE